MLQDLRQMNSHHALQAREATLQCEVEMIAAEVEANVAWVKAERQALVQDLRRFLQASCSGDPEASLDRMVADIQAMTALVHDSIGAVRTKLEGRVRQELIRAVETALSDEDEEESSPTRGA